MATDFIQLAYGLSFIALASLVGVLGRSGRAHLPWRWLAVFALLHGTVSWLDLLAAGLWDSPIFRDLRAVMLIGALVLLLEFGRRGLVAQGIRINFLFGTAPFLALTIAGGLSGTIGWNAASRVALGFPGGFLTAVVLWREAAKAKEKASASLALAGAGFFMHGLAAGFESREHLPEAAFRPDPCFSITERKLFRPLYG
jgi:hypothetical protein